MQYFSFQLQSKYFIYKKASHESVSSSFSGWLCIHLVYDTCWLPIFERLVGWGVSLPCRTIPYYLPYLITQSVGPTTIPNYLRYPTIMTLPCTGKPACPATPHSQLSLRWDSGRCTIKEGAVVNTGMSFILPIIWIGLVKIIS